MTSFVVVHGAFRGPWYWDPLADELGRSGDLVEAVDLQGTDLGGWIGCVTAAVHRARDNGEGIVLVGHSMGGVVAQASLGEVGPDIQELVLLDSPLIAPGQRAVDVSGPAPPDDVSLPPREFWIPPTRVGPAQGFDDPSLARWVNDRLRPVPMGPQLDPVPATPVRSTRVRIVFFDRTPMGYPSTYSRTRCEEEGLDHRVIDQHHDAPVLAPAAVARLLRGPTVGSSS